MTKSKKHRCNFQIAWKCIVCGKVVDDYRDYRSHRGSLAGDYKEEELLEKKGTTH